MLKRCYNEKIHEKQPTYKDCHVVKSWHNFQNFASWYVQQKGHDLDWHLDKDILVKGNKVYGPKRCCLVPVHINSLLTKHDAGRGNLPIGVSKHQNKYRVRCMLNKVNTTIGIYYSVKKAFKAYKETKEAEIKRVAKLYKNEIDPKVYKALMDYEVEIDD